MTKIKACGHCFISGDVTEDKGPRVRNDPQVLQSGPS